MNKQAGLSNGPVVGAVGIAAVAVAGAVLYFSGVIGPSDPIVPEPVALLTVEPVADVKPATPDEAVEAEPQPDLEIVLPDPPSIDTFRLEPDGNMLVAGQAHPDWQTSILLDAVALQRVTPDMQGKFVAFLTLAESDQPRILSLQMVDEKTGQIIVSKNEIVIAPIARPQPEPKPETAESGAGATTANPEPEIATVEADTATMVPDQPQSQTVLLVDDQGVEVLQPAQPTDLAPDVMSSVALDAISYSEVGEVQLAGRAQGEGFVRVYLDNAPVTTSRIQDNGNWRTELPQVDTGIYTLRIDEVDVDGTVTSRVETPFKREDETLVTAGSDAVTQARITAITVQPGSTLWAISRETYGDGVMYVRVFEANRDRIRDPDLIYPGQVFTLPE